MRIVVPELPQSSTVSGSRSPARPLPRTRDGVVGRLHADAERVEARRGGGDVGAVGQAADRRPSVGERGEEQRPVRDPLAAGQAQPAPQRPTPGDGQLARRHDRGHERSLRLTW